MIGAWLMLLCAVTAIFLAIEGWQAWLWRHRGEGERKARLEYARMHRDGVDTAEARLSETEFISYYVDRRPRATRYVVAVLVLLLVGIPASIALVWAWPWH